jgi:hypothetical protein
MVSIMVGLADIINPFATSINCSYLVIELKGFAFFQHSQRPRLLVLCKSFLVTPLYVLLTSCNLLSPLQNVVAIH